MQTAAPLLCLFSRVLQRHTLTSIQNVVCDASWSGCLQGSLRGSTARRFSGCRGSSNNDDAGQSAQLCAWQHRPALVMAPTSRPWPSSLSVHHTKHVLGAALSAGAKHSIHTSACAHGSRPDTAWNARSPVVMAREIHKCLATGELFAYVDKQAARFEGDIILMALQQVPRAVRLPVPSEHKRQVKTILSRLTMRLAKRMDQFDLEQISKALHVCAQMEYTPEPLLEVLLPRLQQEEKAQLATGKPEDVVAITSSIANLQVTDPRLWQQLDSVLLGCLHRLQGPEIAKVAIAHATATLKHPELFQAIVRSSSHRLHQFSPEEMSRLLWAGGKLGHSSEKTALGERLSEWAGARLRQCSHEQLAMLAWGAARMQLKHGMLVAALAQETAQRLAARAAIQAEVDANIGFVVPVYAFTPQEAPKPIPTQAVAIIVEAVAALGLYKGKVLYQALEHDLQALNNTFEWEQTTRQRQAAQEGEVAAGGTEQGNAEDAEEAPISGWPYTMVQLERLLAALQFVGNREALQTEAQVLQAIKNHLISSLDGSDTEQQQPLRGAAWPELNFKL